MTYSVMVVNKDAVKQFVDNVASKFTKEELENNSMFFNFPRYGSYSLELNFEWDRYDFIYKLLESKEIEKVEDEVLQKAAVLFRNPYIEVIDIIGVRHAIDKLEKLLKFDDDHGKCFELDDEVRKIYGENRAYKYDQNSCKALIDDLTRIKDVMENPRKENGETANVYWMIYAY